MTRKTHLALVGLMMLALFLTGCSDDGPTAPRDTGEDLAMEGTTFPLGITGWHYAEFIRPSGGVLPYSWSVTTGQLPPGISAAGSASVMEISGTGVAAGAYDFEVTVTDAEGTSVIATFSMTMVDEIDLSGTWSANIQVTTAGGTCGNEVGSIQTPQLTIIQNITTLEVSGFLGEPTNIATGFISSGNSVHITGSWSEDGGTTDVRHDWTVLTPNLMVGTEEWDWTIDGGPGCPNSTSAVTLTRVTF